MSFLQLRHAIVLCVARPKSSYTSTINSPVFPFTIHHKSSQADRVNSSWNKFYQSRLCDFRRPLFVLHDGPPYANGDLHIGHALNKILKDIIIRLKLLSGYSVQFTPGWDCHGLPIELKALEKSTFTSPIEVRKAASLLAKHYVDAQRSSFMDWGVIGSWDDCYKTMDKRYQAQEMRAFASLYSKGLVYQGLMPIYWSPCSKSALAESELEYNQEYKSISVHLLLLMTKLGNKLSSIVSELDNPVYALIWTTTPWTLPSNEAIAYDPHCSYVVIHDVNMSRVLVTNETFASRLGTIYCDHTFLKLGDIPGTDLQECFYRHPFRCKTQRDVSAMPFLPASYVSQMVGTGLVHTAPCHGQDDFILGCKYGLPMDLIVDDNGRFMDQAGPQLSGLSVLEEGNLKVIELIQPSIIHKETITHSYPHDWRAKTPVIIRISEQWFIDTAKLSDYCVSAYQDVVCIPSSRKASMLPFISNRPQWCISRQRSWGLPIPVILRKKDMSPIVDQEFINHIANRCEESGSDFWFTESLDELVPEKFWSKWSITSKDALKNVDVFDVWFDSGLSWLCALQDRNKNAKFADDSHTMADLYIEGQDQFRGWFSSSLILGVALTGRSPYKSVIAHGFVTDSEGRKMSKSIGNVISPQDILESEHGCSDILRRWAASSGLDALCPVGPKELDRHRTRYKALRNCLRFMLGNLHDFCPRTHLLNLPGTFDSTEDRSTTTLDLTNLSLSSSLTSLCVLDKAVLCLLGRFISVCMDTYYPQFRFDTLFSDLDQLVSQLSEYFTLSKDKLYFDDPDNSRRRSVQTTLWLAVECLMALLAPLQPYLIEEVESARETQLIRAYQQTRSSGSTTLLERLSSSSIYSRTDTPNPKSGTLSYWSVYLSEMQKWSRLNENLEATNQLLLIRDAILKSYSDWLDENPDYERTGSKTNPLSNLHVHISIPVEDQKLQHFVRLHHADATIPSESSDLCLLMRSASVSWSKGTDTDLSHHPEALELTLSVPNHELLVRLNSIKNGGRCHRCHRFSHHLVNHVCQRCSVVLAKRFSKTNISILA